MIRPFLSRVLLTAGAIAIMCRLERTAIALVNIGCVVGRGR